MAFDHGADVEKSEAVAARCLSRAVANAIELSENPLMIFPRDTHAAIRNREINAPSPFVAPHSQRDINIFGRVAHGIVQEIAKEVVKMRRIGKNGLDFGRDVDMERDGTLRFEVDFLRETVDERTNRHLLLVKMDFRAAAAVERQHLFDERRKALQLSATRFEQSRPALCVFAPAEINQGLVRRQRHGDRRLEFVGDVVGKVGRRLFQFLLSQKKNHQAHCAEQQQGEEKKRQIAGHFLSFLIDGRFPFSGQTLDDTDGFFLQPSSPLFAP